MPTKDDLTGVLRHLCADLLKDLLSQVNTDSCSFILQQVYELGIIIISYDCGKRKVSDSTCKEVIDGWKTLINVRNIISHSYYNMKLLNEHLYILLYKTHALREISEFIFSDDYTINLSNCLKEKYNIMSYSENSNSLLVLQELDKMFGV